MITRREMVIAVAAGALVSPLGSFSQQQSTQSLHRIGLLSGGSNPRKNSRWAAFFAAMVGLGYEEGRNVA